MIVISHDRYDVLLNRMPVFNSCEPCVQYDVACAYCVHISLVGHLHIELFCSPGVEETAERCSRLKLERLKKSTKDKLLSGATFGRGDWACVTTAVYEECRAAGE